MERVISQNIHQSQLSRYRSLEPLDQNGNKTVDESDMTDFDHGLIRLWSFKDAQLGSAPDLTSWSVLLT
jgi:hypothetical protein